jgi:hypothetical protein
MSAVACIEELCRRRLRYDAPRIFASDGGTIEISQFGELGSASFDCVSCGD